MRPPLLNGTVLQDRYRILSVLGQGGFGRTYLAEDQGRFNELCALKELTPADVGAYALEKSKELFQREAQTLYQIQHPQIPQFRATFEYEQRLFLVQDYVEGQTYRHLLDQRRSQGYTFSEAEVKQLLLQLLPVLAHIHNKGIIHRDITPDNMILRSQDHLPVLIDFGVVKELATRFQAPGSVFPGGAGHQTTVGKVGYAPPEQLQTGRAYASSDLYSLAVTAVVMLTGREPQELFDDATLTWYWQRWVTTSPQFAQVLNRMLTYRPGDRYQSAGEVMQALQTPTLPSPAMPPPYPPPQPSYQPPPPDVSRVPTMAVGHRPDPVPVPRQTEPVVEPRSSVWDDPWAVTAIGLALVMLTGIASWAIVRAVLNPDAPPNPLPTETTVVSPDPSPTETATPKPKPTVEPVTYSQRLEVAPDTKLAREGSLKDNETINYIFAGQQGEQLSALLSGEGVLMTVRGPNKEPVGEGSRRVSYWQGTLPYTGDYYIELKTVKGIKRSDYQLEMTLKSVPTPEPSPSPTDSPSPAPSIDTARVQFPAGATSTIVADQASPTVTKRYLVNARRGQIFQAKVASGAVTLTIRYPGGQPVEDAANVLSWESELPRNGDYMVDVVAFQDTNFELDLSVKELVR